MFRRTISRWSTNSNQKWHKTLNSFFEKKFWHFSESKNDNDLNYLPFPSSSPLPSLPFSLPPLPPPTLTTAAALQRMRGMQHHSKGGGKKAAPPKKIREGSSTTPKKEKSSTTSSKEDEESSTTQKEAGKQHHPQSGRGEGESNTSPNEEGRSPVGGWSGAGVFPLEHLSDYYFNSFIRWRHRHKQTQTNQQHTEHHTQPHTRSRIWKKTLPEVPTCIAGCLCVFRTLCTSCMDDVETIDSLARYEASPACAENASFLRSIDRRPTAVHNKPVSALRSSGCVLRCVCGCWVVRDFMINWLQTITVQLRTKTKIALKSHKKTTKKMKDRNCQLKTKWLTQIEKQFSFFFLRKKQT